MQRNMNMLSPNVPDLVEPFYLPSLLLDEDMKGKWREEILINNETTSVLYELVPNFHWVAARFPNRPY